MTYIAAELV